MRYRLPLRGLCALAVVTCAAGSQALTFNFTYDSGMDPNAVAGFNAAGAMWSSLFSDNVTVNLSIDFRNEGSSWLGATWSNEVSQSYSGVRTALTSDAKSGLDFSAISSLQSGSSINVATNRWKNSPSGSGSATPFTTSLSNLSITTANCKALGLVAGNDPSEDGSIAFNSYYSWDFDRSNGISGSSFDFVGIAAHEIGHALGFISGVDSISYYYSSYNSTGIAWASALDLFRYREGYSTPYLCADNTAKYFSVDGGLTDSSYLFSNGTTWGDGSQASHWKDNLGLGILDPTAGYGEYMSITALDAKAFDAIGWDTVPEPATMVGLALGALALVARRRRK